jgi:hypothetical protein
MNGMVRVRQLAEEARGRRPELGGGRVNLRKEKSGSIEMIGYREADHHTGEP